METLAYVGGSPLGIETEFETEKSFRRPGRVRGPAAWAGWHHHVALCLLGGAFLLQPATGLTPEKMPRISVGRRSTRWCWEMLPRERFPGRTELLR